MSDAPTNIVEKAFWENDYYWARAELPCRVDTELAFDRSLARALAAYAAVQPGQSVLEVGCAPAKWLLFYAERFGAAVAGIEYSDKGATLSRENLRAAGVPSEIQRADFFDVPPRPYDLVLSIGFIEHFDDIPGTFERHLRFVAPGGRLAIGVPNFRGVNRALQWLAEPEYLALHNIAAMRPSLYREMAAVHDLELEHIGYLGGLDPAIIRLGRGPALSPRRVLPGAATLAERRWRSLALGERLEHRWLSSYLLAVYRSASGGVPYSGVTASTSSEA
ncbi:MAG TPA: class I SAM-dependent methyltransferase [Solirubrobacteraceae bacterium]|jgi:SAM-dependent methyltransferase